MGLLLLLLLLLLPLASDEFVNHEILGVSNDATLKPSFVKLITLIHKRKMVHATA